VSKYKVGDFDACQYTASILKSLDLSSLFSYMSQLVLSQGYGLATYHTGMFSLVEALDSAHL
jgi:hypothetical protein